MQLSDYETKALQKLGESIHEGKWSNEGLVQLIELSGTYLNLRSVQQYADDNNKSYNGIKKTKKISIVLGDKCIIEND